MEKVYTIHRKEQEIIKRKRKVWAVEAQDGDTAENSEHTSRSKAILNFSRTHPNNGFFVTIPSTGEELTACKNDNGNGWIVTSRNTGETSQHSSLAKAITKLNSHLANVDSFHIGVLDSREGI